MSGADLLARRGGGLASLLLVGLAFALLGLVTSLGAVVGVAVGLGGLAAGTALRRFRPSGAGAIAAVPVLVALGFLGITAPVAPASELVGSLASLSVLLWFADDPTRPAGGGRRAAPAIALCTAAVGVAWCLALALPSTPPAIGVAGAMLAFVVLLLALLFERAALGPDGPAAEAAGGAP